MDDDGTIVGIAASELTESLDNLEGMCQTVGAKTVSFEKRRVSRRPELFAAEVCIRLESLGLPSTTQEPVLRRFPTVAFVGETGGGKSTLIGVLTAGSEVGLDNGQGSVRLGMLRHRHELISGQTSSVAVEFLPFDPVTNLPIHPDGDSFVEPVPLAMQKRLLSTHRVVQLLDLAGDPKYHKTTYSALTTWKAPDWICVVIPATAFTVDSNKTVELNAASHDILNLVLGLEIPFFLVMTKVDLINTEASVLYGRYLLDRIVQLRKALLGLDLPSYALSLLQVSSVSGAGLKNLANHFSRLRARRNVRLNNFLLEEAFPGTKFLFCVQGSQMVPGVGLVLAGIVAYGALELANGSDRADLVVFYTPISKATKAVPLILRSAHRMRLPVHSLYSGQMVTLAVEPLQTAESLPSPIEKGSILAFYGADQPVPPLIPYTSTVEADVVANVNLDELETVLVAGDPIQGTLYWLGNRWPAQLISIRELYGEAKMRVRFQFTPHDTVLAIPGTRVIWVGPQFRVEGFIYLPKK